MRPLCQNGSGRAGGTVIETEGRRRGVMEEKQLDPFDSDFETARMRLRNLADNACEELNARMLNLASFHLSAYMDFASNHKGRLVKIMMSEIAAEQLNAAAVREGKAGAPITALTKPRRMRKSKGQ